MEIIGNSSLWVEKYRPQTVDDIILPAKYKTLIKNIILKGDIPNLLFSGSAGLGKSTLALVLGKALKADVLFINASMENSADTLRYKVNSFAMTSSFSDGKKIVILDEFERMTSQAQDMAKGIFEMTESNCRFILTTNNLSKIIDPIQSRTQLINFNFTQTDTQEIIVQYFKRCQFILDTEKITYDKKILADFIKKIYPDFRKIINELQKASNMFGCIDESVYKVMDDAIVTDLIKEMKNKKFFAVQTLVGKMDADQFFKIFYEQIVEHIKPESIPDIVLILAEGGFRITQCIDKELQVVASAVQIMKVAHWK